MRQTYFEFSSFTLPCLHLQRPPVPFHHDVVRNGQPQSGTFPGRFGSEKRLEDFGFHIVGNAGTVVFYFKYNLAVFFY